MFPFLLHCLLHLSIISLHNLPVFFFFKSSESLGIIVSDKKKKKTCSFSRHRCNETGCLSYSCHEPGRPQNMQTHLTKLTRNRRERKEDKKDRGKMNILRSLRVIKLPWQSLHFKAFHLRTLPTRQSLTASQHAAKGFSSFHACFIVVYPPTYSKYP